MKSNRRNFVAGLTALPLTIGGALGLTKMVEGGEEKEQPKKDIHQQIKEKFPQGAQMHEYWTGKTPGIFVDDDGKQHKIYGIFENGRLMNVELEQVDAEKTSVLIFNDMKEE